jgi:hypothetical protein
LKRHASTKTIDVIDADHGAVAGGDAARAKLLAATKPVQMTPLAPTDPVPDVDTRRVYADLTDDACWEPSSDFAVVTW